MLAGTRGAYYDLWTEPVEFADADPATFTQYLVTAADVGFLDNVAVRVWGQGNETQWWIIAAANGMIDPESEMCAGQVLLIPSLAAVRNFLARTGNA